MDQVTFTLRFQGCATPLDTAPNAARVTMTARSSSLTTIIGPQGVRSLAQPVPAEVARFEATVRKTGEATFSGSGMVAFGDNGHYLRISTHQPGWWGSGPDSQSRQGTVTWHVEGGTGQFARAQGLISSVFLVTADGHVSGCLTAALFLT
jgi:hypothetical protein